MSRPLEDRSTQELFEELRRSGNEEVRAHLIERHEGLVRHVVNDYRDSGAVYEDLIGVGHIGLINAVDRFDPARGTKFATFAVPTIRGELRRYFRDSMWGMRVPRRVQELSLKVRDAIDDFVGQHGRSPTYSELALKLGVSEEAVIEAVEVSNQYELASIEETGAEGDDPDGGLSVADRAGEEDEELEALGDRDRLKWALEQLPPRQRVIIKLRFFNDMSQQQVARRLGISQMHVSRLQRKALEHLKRIFASEEAKES
ncbi:MAG: SigB/SigF/SigG family RNA polymerase sigma factor [Armatimonadetes bacterium]|nr:SigB/SigF/SigG family RNA polymerase sigma factor [Armatimonadota bacterium]